MNLLGIHLTLLIGPTLAVPAPLVLADALSAVEVTHNDSGRSGFQLTFQVGRSGPQDLVDYGLLENPALLKPWNRVVLVVRLAVAPKVLFDGFITQVQLQPGSQPGASTLTVIGEDVSVMMDLEQKSVEHPGLADPLIVARLIAGYPLLQMVPVIVPPPSVDVPVPTRRVPVQNGTDLEHLQTMAERHGYVFFVKPGLVPMQNVAYWGPPPRGSVPQRALSVNMGPATNTESMSFQYNALAPTTVSGTIQDAESGLQVPVESFPVSTRIPLASRQALLVQQPQVRKTLFGLPARSAESPTQASRPGGQEAETPAALSYSQAMARAQAMVDASTDKVVTASGELDALRYGELLEPRGLVGVRGVGRSYDGHYYVQSVTHSIRKGEYKQRFVLNREGTGSLTPLVRA